MSHGFAAILEGFLLGWSVAWPPGPINAEMVRRGLARGFRAAAAVGLGACSGDALWAIIVALGAGLAAGAEARALLATLSTVLLLALGAFFLWGAWRAAATPAGAAAPPAARPGAGYVLGLTMALTSPWNLAFWLAVIGRPETHERGLGVALLVAAAVILGAGLWVLLLCGAVARLRVHFAAPLWQIGAQAATGFLMLLFAWRSLQHFNSG